MRARANSIGAGRALIALLSDSDFEIRAQAARTLGDSLAKDSRGTSNASGSPDRIRLEADAVQQLTQLVKGGSGMLVKDGEMRARSCAAQALSKIPLTGDVAPTIAAFIELVAKNDNHDPVVRHTASLALANALGGKTPKQVDDMLLIEDAFAPYSRLLQTHAAPAVRLAGVLALRQLKHPEIAKFLDDTDPRVVLEAARAIHDLPIAQALPQVAALGDRKLSASPEVQDALLRRVLSANFKIGDEAAAKRVARIAADAQAPDKVRIEALEELKQWDAPPPLDRVLGDWRPIEKRDAKPVADAVRTVLGGLFTGSDAVRKTAGEVAAKYGIKEVEPVLADVFKDEKQTGDARASALNALVGLKSAQATALSEQALKDKEPLVRIEGRRSLAKLKPADQLMLAELALEGGEIIEKQAALADLAAHKDVEASNIIGTWLDRLLSGDLPKEIQLDVLEAAKKRRSLLGKVATFEKSFKADDPLAKYRVTLAGGSIERGRDIFLNRSEVSCRRCHTIAGNGGAVGPELTKIAKEKSREYLLESIVLPSAQIAKGFETMVVVTNEGRSYAGIVKENDDKQLKLMLADGTLQTIAKSDIDETAKGQSAMPADLIKHLSASDVRDLVEFLSSLK